MFNCEADAITISDCEASLINKREYQRELFQLFEPHSYLIEKYVEQLDTYAFTIIEPFDKTYTPGRSVKIGTFLADSYFSSFEKTLNQMCKRGIIQSLKRFLLPSQ